MISKNLSGSEILGISGCLKPTFSLNLYCVLIKMHCFHAPYLIQHSQLHHPPEFSDEKMEGRKNRPLSKVP